MRARRPRWSRRGRAATNPSGVTVVLDCSRSLAKWKKSGNWTA